MKYLLFIFIYIYGCSICLLFFIVYFGGGSWGLIVLVFFDNSKGIVYVYNIKLVYVSYFYI